MSCSGIRLAKLYCLPLTVRGACLPPGYEDGVGVKEQDLPFFVGAQHRGDVGGLVIDRSKDPVSSFHEALECLRFVLCYSFLPASRVHCQEFVREEYPILATERVQGSAASPLEWSPVDR